MYSMHFAYNEKGRGELQLLQDGTIQRGWLCRCGSIDNNGALVNATPPETYKILEPAALERENEAMKIDGVGWWCRLFTTSGERTHLGIHPDGGKGGTKGCIGTSQQDLPLMGLINEIIKTQYQILVEVEYKV